MGLGEVFGQIWMPWQTHINLLAVVAFNETANGDRRDGQDAVERGLLGIETAHLLSGMKWTCEDKLCKSDFRRIRSP